MIKRYDVWGDEYEISQSKNGQFLQATDLLKWIKDKRDGLENELTQRKLMYPEWSELPMRNPNTYIKIKELQAQIDLLAILRKEIQ